jgi:hypothetical protein
VIGETVFRGQPSHPHVDAGLLGVSFRVSGADCAESASGGVEQDHVDVVVMFWLLFSPELPVAALCQRILLGTRGQAARMAAPLVGLDHDRLDPRISEMIENTLYYAFTGDRRPTAQQAENVPQVAR